MGTVFKSIIYMLSGLVVVVTTGLFSLYLKIAGYVSHTWIPFVVMMLFWGIAGGCLFYRNRRKRRAKMRAEWDEMERERLRAKSIMQELWADESWAKSQDSTPSKSPKSMTDEEWLSYISK